MIPQQVTQKEYDAIPDTHVHLTDEIEVIHKHPRMGIAALNAKIKDGWNICLKDGSKADADEVKRVKAFVKKVVDTETKREEKRLADVVKQTDRAKFTAADLDKANDERDEAIGKLEDAQAEVDTLRDDLTKAESDLERDPEADQRVAVALKDAETDAATAKEAATKSASDLKDAVKATADEAKAREIAETKAAELEQKLKDAGVTY